MAQITINIDTETDEMEVNLDGKVITDVEAVSVYSSPRWEDPSERELNILIQTCLHDKKSGIKTNTTIMAADTSDAKDLKSKGVKTYAKNKDFIILTDFDKIKYDLLERFGGL